MSRKGQAAGADPRQRGDFSTLPPAVHFDPVILPDLAQAYYARRAARLRQLGETSELAAYLGFAADITDVQDAASALVPAHEARALPIDPVAEAEGGLWLPLLDALVDGLRARVTETVRPHLDHVAEMSGEARRQAAAALAGGRFAEVPAEVAPFVWAAFSIWLRALAAGAILPSTGDDAAAEHAQCPVCGIAPVASVILTGARQGLRYLHCALCETDWHMVRAKCSNCGDAGKLEYLSFETAEASVRAECCGHCKGYLKVVSLDRDHAADVVADDLATLPLDAAVEEEGYRRTGFNPFALPG
ncbi:formate dehydrogenase accessory protein FdhE [Rhizobiaceae bacterium BDR2-2]|uniref:Protein FdhE homolog n=1 Tax=Ectorhizobium quercum TaxID=2965071 RepID=A0AAE3N4S3_9HYPH|nr:formate dehydrogenase accessory protein FdhE [Ectorhizobium quercum]MCX8999689.1 formate dehydrogenase accessory protein FdhE [Ectorhizobium quercum]